MPILLIAIAEWFATALWFTPNAVIGALQTSLGITPTDLGWLTGGVQLGFLLGTLTLALSGIADRVPASRLFALACLIGAGANAALTFADSLVVATLWRVVTGCCLAGIYPIGMKLMVRWVPESTGLALSWLVGMLVLGTAMPHLLAALDWGGDYRSTLWLASLMALVAGGVILRLGEPSASPIAAQPASSDTSTPSERPPSRAAGFRLGGLDAFRVPAFRRAAGAYFGHMWELYTLWALLPLLLAQAMPALGTRETALTAFALIAVGAPGCWIGGWASQHLGSQRIARIGLAGSAGCAALFPWFAEVLAPAALVAWMALWSLLAVIDSPHFSALSARACPPPLLGSALTLQNAIGFGVSAVSLGLLVPALPALEAQIAWLLLPGPLVGLWALRRREADAHRSA
ncbi:MFS transporter [Salinicola aestuarinus]|uniref:MFS transporter n=1 Tax=Salinicola aestuarinus TaxID=1949082 RepID=UPI000DA194DB|nr:MFS transporter [Salinicola aestuarinus]